MSIKHKQNLVQYYTVFNFSLLIYIYLQQSKKSVGPPSGSRGGPTHMGKVLVKKKV